MAEPLSWDVAPAELSITWPDAAPRRFHALWLRDNCPTGGERANAFRTFSVADLDPGLTIASAELDATTATVLFDDGHRSRFDLDWLRRHGGEPASRPARRRPVDLWRGGDSVTEVSSPVLEPGGPEHLDLLEALARRGVTVVRGVSGEEEATEALAGLLGRIRETDFGRLFDIVSEPDAWTKSQTGDALAPHTDDPYRYTPSGMSVLHCVAAGGPGGESILVDGFAVAEEIRRVDPDAFELLSVTSVPFARHRPEIADQGDDVHLRAHARIIAVDRDDEICGIRFHERSMAPLDLAPDIMGDYYRALIRFTTMATGPEFCVLRRLEQGEALMFDNQRVLHGRTAFDGARGRRHLRLCTVDRDQAHSRLRRLREIHGRVGVDEWLPAGNLA